MVGSLGVWWRAWVSCSLRLLASGRTAWSAMFSVVVSPALRLAVTSEHVFGFFFPARPPLLLCGLRLLCASLFVCC